MINMYMDVMQTEHSRVWDWGEQSYILNFIAVVVHTFIEFENYKNNL